MEICGLVRRSADAVADQMDKHEHPVQSGLKRQVHEGKLLVDAEVKQILEPLIAASECDDVFTSHAISLKVEDRKEHARPAHSLPSRCRQDALPLRFSN